MLWHILIGAAIAPFVGTAIAIGTADLMTLLRIRD
jgi:hypothetical protein